jgi:hypothetical protein
MEEDIIALLLTTISGLQLHPGTRPQGSPLPSATINVISSVPAYSDDGEDGLQDDRVQFDCYGKTYTSAKQLARQITTVLSAYKGGNFLYITLELQRDQREGGKDEAEYLFRTTLDFIVTYRK